MPTFTGHEDRKAAFLINELANQGRWIDVIAQMWASIILNGDRDADSALTDLALILAKVTDLFDLQGNIWPGLMPGGPVVPDEFFAVLEPDDIARLAEAEALLTRLADSHRNPGTPGREDLQNAQLKLSLVAEKVGINVKLRKPTLPPLDEQWSMSVWQGEDNVTFGLTETASTVTKLAQEVKDEIEMARDRVANKIGASWFVWITGNADESNYIMTYDEAEMILQMDSANDMYVKWSNTGDPLYANDAYQEIVDFMRKAGEQFAAMRQ